MSITVNQGTQKPRTELHDGAETLLKCSGCDKPLVFVWANQPNLDVDFKVRADCCYCEDHSFPIEVHGGFAVRGFDRELDCPENVRPIVNITNINYQDTDVTVETEKV